ncbi:DUF3892 domain-containing protein [Pedobacter arcticus]|uniref:DUF3892 domain-containing protein n=1 Tax=Pedobacter arcticus TaxID=752140 RepID=UPI0002DB311F|nr:DUF3892 domain-containing protein [Pedobacter arcticus]
MAIDYFINGVWKDTQERITHVSLCKNNSSTFSGGVKKSESEVIRLIKAGNLAHTLIWLYPDWKIGAKVEVVSNNGREYLRTVANTTAIDNLDNCMDMKGFYSL